MLRVVMFLGLLCGCQSDTRGTCVTGRSELCVCDGVNTGVHSCGTDGYWEPCECGEGQSVDNGGDGPASGSGGADAPGTDGAAEQGTGGSSGDCSAGADGCPCSTEGLCLTGLTCIAGLCGTGGGDSSGTPKPCSPGRYTGAVTGTYRALALGTFPVEISSDGLGGELTGMQLDVTLRDGVLVAEGDFNAVVGAGLVPVHASVTNGVLDCAAARFEADIVNGLYSAGADSYAFKGKLISRYDAESASFTNGLWAVSEGGARLPSIDLDLALPAPDASTGTGSWAAGSVTGP